MSTTSKTEFEKLLSTPGEEKWKESVTLRKANKDWLNLSADIALKVMDEMDKQGIKGNELAARMGVSPQQVSKILKGRENLKLETITKLNNALGVKLVTILAEDEVVVKNDMTSLFKLLTTQLETQHIKMKLAEVSQRREEVKVSVQPTVKQNFPLTQGYVKVVVKSGTKAGELNYAMSA